MSDKHLTANISESIEFALAQIETNAMGIVFITSENKVVGSLSDGDIRRHLISGGLITDSVEICYNRNFTWVYEEQSQEPLLKLFDDKIKHVPVLNSDMTLNYIASRNHIKLQTKKKKLYRSRAPVRVSLAGGGSDVHYYFSIHGEGAVVSASVSKYAYVTISPRDDKKIEIISAELKSKKIIESISSIAELPDTFRLFSSVISTLTPKSGFTLIARTDFEIGSGLGGSSSLCVALVGAFSEFLNLKLKRYEIANLAYHIERNLVGISGGWQDQYASTFGGFNYIEFNSSNNLVYPLRIEPDTGLELQSNMFLCSTNQLHDSHEIHKNQEITIMESNEKQKLVERNVELCRELKQCLLVNDLSNFAKILDKSWYLKKQFGSQITNDQLDMIYRYAKANGAQGGKLLGAGGGGFFLFYVNPVDQVSFLIAMSEMGYECNSIVFDQDGLTTWIEELND